MNDRMIGLQQAQMQQSQMGRYEYEAPKPVLSPADAAAALARRAEVLRGNLSKVAEWEKELATVMRMLAAAKEEP